jgi:hypothetical protein
MLKLLWELFLFYLLYKFIFGFVIPVCRTTRQVKKQMNQFQQRFQEEQKTHERPPQPKQSSSSGGTRADSSGHNHEYVDFEEVK